MNAVTQKTEWLVFHNETDSNFSLSIDDRNFSGAYASYDGAFDCAVAHDLYFRVMRRDGDGMVDISADVIDELREMYLQDADGVGNVHPALADETFDFMSPAAQAHEIAELRGDYLCHLRREGMA